MNSRNPDKRDTNENMAIWIPVSLLALCGIVSGLGQNVLPDYKDHPCIRECVEGASPMTCVYNFTLEYYYVLTKACYDCPYNYTDCFRPHCVAANGVPRAIMTVNRMMPGPAIHVCLGDMVVVNVYNKLGGGEGTTIHWHGVFQKDSPHHDGANMITQCPITENSRFEYRFRAGNRGTHFWHAHSGIQRTDGIFGAFIIREPRSRDPSSSLYQHDLAEHVMIVHDWMNEMTTAAQTERLMAGLPLFSPSILINGRGAYKEFIHPTTNMTTHTPFSVFPVTKDQRYRFRVISNGAMKCPIQISVDSHELTLIASDGVPFDPVVLSSFNIYPGERFDFLLEADKAIGNYWIRARGLMDCVPFSATQVAILRYDDAPQTEPRDPTDYKSGIREGKLLNPLNKKGTVDMIPLSWLNSTQADPPDMKQVPDKTFYLSMDFFLIDYYPYFPESTLFGIPQINRRNNFLPPSPLLTQYHDIPKDLFCGPQHTVQNCSDKFCECIYIINIALNDTVEIVFVNDGTFVESVTHPMHLHGQNFRVVAMKKLDKSTSVQEIKTMDSSGMIFRNLDTPIAKDTVTVPDPGYTIIRFKADGPGFWPLHCHVATHNYLGMGVVFQVGTLDQMPRPPKNFPRCGGWRYIGEEDKRPIPEECPTAGSGNLLSVYLVVTMVTVTFLTTMMTMRSIA